MRCATSWLASIGLALSLAGCGQKPAALEATPPIVEVAEAIKADAPSFGETLATLGGSSNRLIYSPVEGYLLKQAYVDDSTVEAGQLLFEIDTRSFPTVPPQPKTFKINSPIEGVAGPALRGEGDSVTPGTAMATVSIVDPIQAEFRLPAKAQLDSAEEIELVLEEGKNHSAKGRISSIERKGGITSVYALFPNADRTLRPGQLVKVRPMQQAPDAVLIPLDAAMTSGGVWEVQADSSVVWRKVKLGDRIGTLQMVTEGLKVGEKVVVEGAEKCHERGKVAPQPYVPPTQGLR